MNSAIGAGVLGIPFAFQQAGLVLSVVLIAVFCPFITFTLHIMGRAQKFANKGTYQATCEQILGPKSKIMIIVLQLAFIIGACIGYLIIIADNLLPQLKSWCGEDSFFANREVIILLALVPITPMCFIKNIQNISPLATFSILAIVCVARPGPPPPRAGSLVWRCRLWPRARAAPRARTVASCVCVCVGWVWARGNAGWGGGGRWR